MTELIELAPVQLHYPASRIAEQMSRIVNRMGSFWLHLGRSAEAPREPSEATL